MSEVKELWIAIDIEKVNSSISKGLVAIGIAYSIKTNDFHNVKEIKAWCMPFPDIPTNEKEWSESIMDKITYKEFWKKDELQSVIKRIKEEQRPFDESMLDFVTFYNSLETIYPNAIIKIISDNPAYDIGHVDNAIEVSNTRSYGLRYNSDGKIYRSCIDPKQRLNALGMHDIVDEMVNNQVKHDHWPANDAHHHLLMMIECEKLQNSLSNTLRSIHNVEYPKQLTSDSIAQYFILISTTLLSSYYYSQYNKQYKKHHEKNNKK